MSSLYLIGVLTLAVILRFVALGQSFWLDEAAQLIISKQPFAAGNFNGDFQPPLSYILTHVWISFGEVLGQRSEWFFRLPMVAFGVGTVYLLYLLLSDMFDRRAGLLGSLLLATAPFHIYYSQEHRMYAMLTFISVLSWYLLWHKRWSWLALTTTIGIFTHYFFFLQIAAQFVYVLVSEKKSVQKFSMCLALGVAPFLLWLPTFMKQLETARMLLAAWPGWQNISNTGFIRFPGLVIAKFTVGMISPEPRWLYGASVGAFSLGLLLSAGACVHLWRKHIEKRSGLMLLLCMSAVPLMMAWFGGIFVSASSPWRIQFVLPAVLGIVGVGLWFLRGLGKWGKLAGGFVAAYFILQNLFFSSQYLMVEANQREDWRGAVAYTDAAAEMGALVLAEFTAPWAPMEWYSTSFSRYAGASSEQHMTEKSVAAKLDPLIKKHSRIILYSYLFEISDPEKLVESYLNKQGYALTTEKDFRGVGIIKTYVQN